MPIEEEKKLRAQAAQKIKGSSKEAKRRRDAYVYGTLRKMGWRPGQGK